jgi:hypothetical protein
VYGERQGAGLSPATAEISLGARNRRKRGSRENAATSFAAGGLINVRSRSIGGIFHKISQQELAEITE